MKKHLKQLTKDSSIYGIGGVISKAILFLLLPVYTRVFNPSEYGKIEMLVMLNNFFRVFLIFGMDAAQSFYFFEQKSKGKGKQRQVISAIFQWYSLWGICFIAAALFLSPFLNKFLFKDALSMEYFVFAFAGVFFAQYMIQASEVFRLSYKPVRYVGITLGYVALWSLLSVIFVVWFKLGVKGYFMGFCIGGALAALLGCWAIREYLDFSAWHIKLWPKLLKFGSPLIVGGIALYALHTTDRWFILRYHGQHELGIYAIGAKFVILLLFAVNAFREAWLAMGNEALHREDGPELYRVVSKLYLGFAILALVMITALSPFLLRIFSSKPYHGAYPLVGILSWYAVFYGLFAIFCGGIWKKKKTVWTSISMIAAAMINVALDSYLVPRFGGMGAALATAISFFLWNIFALIISEQLWPVHYPLKTLGFQIIVGVVFCWSILFVYLNGFSGWYVFLGVIMATGLLIKSMFSYSQLKNTVHVLRGKVFS